MQKTVRKPFKQRLSAAILAIMFIAASFPASVFAAEGSVKYGPLDYELGGGANVQTDSTRGTYVADTHKEGAYIQINNVDGGGGGTAELSIRYITEMGECTRDLYVNGENVQEILFPITDTTGYWQTWGEIKVEITLEAGNGNTIQLKNESESDKGLNIGEITVTTEKEEIPDVEEVVYEAEDCELGGGVTVNGDIVEGMHTAGAYVQLNNVNGGAEGGAFILRMRYSTGMPDVFKKLYVNGQYIKDIEFPATDNWLWQTYDDIEVTVQLNAGTDNTIRIDNGEEENAYGLNFDRFTILSSDGSQDGKRLVEYEAENGILGGGASVSGSAVGNMHYIGAYCEIAGFDGGANGGEYELIIHYATDNDVSKQVLYVNGERSVVEFPYTGGWNSYSEIKIPVTLNPGWNNVIRIQREDGVDEKETGINIDKFQAYVVGKMTNGDGPRYEAEYCDIGRGARVAASVSASEGAFVENFDTDGAFITESHVNGEQGGVKGLTIRYATESGTDIQKALYVNGEKTAVLTFESTGGVYRNLVTNIVLEPGKDNEITIQNDGNTADVKIDYFEIGESTLLGQWKLNEKYDRTAADTSGMGNNGLLYGNVVWKSGILNNGLKLDGETGYLWIPRGDDTAQSSGFTVSMWVKPETEKDQTIFVKTEQENAEAFSHALRIRNGKFEAYAYDKEAKSVSSVTQVEADTWYYLTMTVSDGDKLKLYVNGNLEGSCSVGAVWDGGDAYLVGSSADKKEFYQGLVDEIRITGTALNEDEIRAQCNEMLDSTPIDLNDVRNGSIPLSDSFKNQNLLYDGALFVLGESEGYNAALCSGQVLDVANGVYDSLRVMGVGGEGAFHIDYADRTSEDITITLDETEVDICNLAISPEKVIEKITLPENSEMRILAMTLVVNQYAEVSRTERIMLEKDTLPIAGWPYTWKRADHPLGEEIGDRDRASAHISTEQFLGMNLNAPVFFEDHNTYDEGLMSGPMANYYWGISGAPDFPGIAGVNPGDLAAGPSEEDWENDYLREDQKAHEDTLYFVTMGDEEGYSDGLVEGVTEWFNLNRNKRPDTLVSTNQWGYQWGEDAMRHYIQTARPDLITFDAYVYDSGPDWDASARLVSNTGYYRKMAMEGWDGTGREPIAFGQHVNAAEIDGRYRTESTTFAMPFATVAMGGKWMNLFSFYNQDAYDGGHFFDEEGNPTKLYEFGSDAFAQIGNLEQHLLHLRSSGVSVLSGQHMSNGVAVNNPIKNPEYTPKFTANPTYYIQNVSAKNTGTTNDGLPGDVLIGYFDPIPEEEQFFSCAAPKYFMVVNLLTYGADNRDPQWAMENGTSAETAQEITLTFQLPDPSLADNLRIVNRETGKTEPVTLTHVADSTYTYTFTVGGGQGDLFFWEEENAVQVDDVVITPSETTVEKGAEVSFSSNEEVTWSVKGGVSDTTIDETGKLQVSENETSTQLVVKAVSKADGTQYATAVVNVETGITSVKITPEKVKVQRGTTYKFSGEVCGEENAVETVIWSVEGGTVGTTITPDGLLTVAADEPAETVTVRAASAADPSKYAEAEVRLTEGECYPVTIGNMEHGTVAADTGAAEAGDTVTLQILPDEGYMLEEGTLRVNGVPIEGASFVMGEEEAVITGSFVKKPADKEELRKLYEECEKKQQEGQYTEESLRRLREALEGAKEILDKEGATQEEIEAAYKALQAARDGLEAIEGKEPEGTESPDTGDYPMWQIVVVLSIAAGVMVLLKRKKQNAEMK